VNRGHKDLLGGMAGSAPEDTFVLIVGGGPVGLTAAIELGWRKVPTILVSENLETARHPKCNNTNARSMEHFRRLGVARDIRAVGLPAQTARENAYVTRFCGYELARMTRPYPLVEQGRVTGGTAEFHKTPEPPHTISQIRLEPILKRHAEQAADVRFGVRLLSFSQDAAGVSALVEDVHSGERREIAARFLIAADGAKSPIRRELGIGMTGEDGTVERAFMGGTMLSYYIRAPKLMAQSGRAPAVITWIINREVRGFMYLQDGREHWIVHFQVPAGVDWTALEPRAVVRAMLGADTEFEILSGGPWTGGMALVAERYRAGRVFLVGDAAHLFTPLGGFGMNTGIGDVMNLGWKLSAAHRGWAGARLLDTFDSERRPIGARNSALGVHCARKMSAWPVPEDIEEPGEAAEARRRAFGAFCVEDDKDQYNNTGLQLGERYEDSPIVCPDGTPAPPDVWSVYTPVERPGARLPHVWLADGRSIYDLLGPDFTLLDCARSDTAAFEAAARARGVPLTVVRMDAPAEPTFSPLVLVRPDQHVAWHGAEVPANAMAVIDRVRGAG
jgi:2-polyprenyl-6-methoxyphenol hydroxylase-like FAD-dependent oxidoreductase